MFQLYGLFFIILGSIGAGYTLGTKYLSIFEDHVRYMISSSFGILCLLGLALYFLV